MPFPHFTPTPPPRYQSFLSILCLYYEEQEVTVPDIITHEMLQKKLCWQQVKKCGSVALKTTTFYFKAPELDASIKKTEPSQQVSFRNRAEELELRHQIISTTYYY